MYILSIVWSCPQTVYFSISCRYQNNNNTTVGMQSHPNSGVNLTHNVRINMKPQPYDGTEDIEESVSNFI
jgi:hypothetical protein